MEQPNLPPGEAKGEPTAPFIGTGLSLQEIFERQGNVLIISNVVEMEIGQVTDFFQGPILSGKGKIVGTATVEDMHAQQRLAGCPCIAYGPEYRFYKVTAE